MSRYWTDAVDEEADAYFATLSTPEIRRRQDLCAQQQRTAYDRRLDDAAADLDRMDRALTREMLARTSKGRR
jgi:hypothetical protein